MKYAILIKCLNTKWQQSRLHVPGTSIRMLSNPYGIATLLKLDADETRAVTPIAKSLIGKRSAVVIRTPNGNNKREHSSCR